jgi:NAD(P)-dependent dehydrogenase (short-subunit alcohol dehydrogenase family)
VSGRLAGRVAVITGSSRGIGLAVARAFLAEGAKLVINSRDPDAAAQVAHDLGGDAVGVGADVTTEAGAAALVKGALEAFGALDVFVNNAGTAMTGDTVDLALDDWRRVLDLNMTAVFLCSREAARHMLAAGGGAIINTASVQSFAPFPRRLAYGASKAAVVQMTRIMAAEWAPSIRVNAVAPGYVRTEMTERLRAEGRIDFDAISRRTPQGRLADPAEMAGAYIYLASAEASFVTGETIVADGGWLAFGAFEGI